MTQFKVQEMYTRNYLPSARCFTWTKVFQLLLYFLLHFFGSGRDFSGMSSINSGYSFLMKSEGETDVYCHSIQYKKNSKLLPSMIPIHSSLGSSTFFITSS